MPAVEFEPAIPASERLWTQTLDRAAARFSNNFIALETHKKEKYISFFFFWAESTEESVL